MQREELESIAKSFLAAFNSDDWERFEGLLHPASEVNETNVDRHATTNTGIVARFREIKRDAPGIVGTAAEWVIDAQQGTVAVEVDLGIADAPDVQHATGAVFLRISDDGKIASIREQHVRRGVDAQWGCVLCMPGDPWDPDWPIEGQDGPDIPRPDVGP